MTKIVKTYTYCWTSKHGFKPCAWVHHTADGKALYSDIKTPSRYEFMDRDIAHRLAYSVKHAESAYDEPDDSDTVTNAPPFISAYDGSYALPY